MTRPARRPHTPSADLSTDDTASSCRVILRQVARWTAVPLLTLGLAAGVGSTTASATPRLTTAAREAGLAPGNATMGWSVPSTRTEMTTEPKIGIKAGPNSVQRAAAVRSTAASKVYGIDVASYQRYVNWDSHWAVGRRFAYVKATEGLRYRNPYFRSQYDGSAGRGFIRGAYHFAIPSASSGARQAEYFVANGGAWRRDGRTLPGTLDIEYNPYGRTCYGLSRTAMVSWIRSFTTRYRQLTGRDAVIYSTTDWWRQCTGNTTAFGRTNPLWIARYASSPGTLPAGWGYYTFWQYSGTTIDKDRFNGSLARLRVLARG